MNHLRALDKYNITRTLRKMKKKLRFINADNVLLVSKISLNARCHFALECVSIKRMIIQGNLKINSVMIENSTKPYRMLVLYFLKWN